MTSEDEKRLKALKDLADRKNKPTEPSKEPYVSDDKDYFKKLREQKDSRRKQYNDNSDNSFKEMLDTKEEVREIATSDLTQEQKEQIAAENLKKKRRELGLK